MRFMIDLAQQSNNKCTALKDIAERQGISKKYLEQVVSPLVGAQLLNVSRGNQGGYRLARPAEEITLAEIVRASEEGLDLLDCLSSTSFCARIEGCPSRKIWGGLQDAMVEYLRGITLADVASDTNDTFFEIFDEDAPRMCNHVRTTHNSH
jgi:Rrf2 family protein